ncbi:hypothetical protein PSTG_17133 [Puccinia striiformis f. sp. tritici PST-78]|uniref:Uncharacterized protein n=1 Tax=Puccinia striiformis f. sp. tritici PST-78 TaxID=1165861 RepID=A0A0L0URM6_9BASI|nr:hypothetical protein PSTG_17133 [Puccinia striiformis f. sp. tritici PST-78]
MDWAGLEWSQIIHDRPPELKSSRAIHIDWQSPPPTDRKWREPLTPIVARRESPPTSMNPNPAGVPSWILDGLSVPNIFSLALPTSTGRLASEDRILGSKAVHPSSNETRQLSRCPLSFPKSINHDPDWMEKRMFHYSEAMGNENRRESYSNIKHNVLHPHHRLHW